MNETYNCHKVFIFENFFFSTLKMTYNGCKFIKMKNLKYVVGFIMYLVSIYVVVEISLSYIVQSVVHICKNLTVFKTPLIFFFILHVIPLRA